MPAAEFDTAHLKAARARVHAKELSEIWNTYLDGHPFDFDLHQTGNEQWTMTITQDRPVPPEMSIVFGEWLFDLRSALDSVIWATAVHVSRQEPPPGEDRLQYPIFESRASWDRNLTRLRPLAEHHREMLLTMQPFMSENPDANFLGWINKLARIDRHRRMTVATAYVAVAEPVVELSGGSEVRLEWGERLFSAGQCDLFRLTTEHPGAVPRANPRMGIDPEIGDWAQSDFYRARRFSDRLRMLETFVRAEIALYEYDCTGESRDWDAASDSFKQESDARRQARDVQPIRRPGRPPVHWTEAGGQRPSTSARLRGEGFMPDSRG
ncbi:hypothetical protein [Frigoribacterium faeni]|uniref:hypothetical protein n=1 Tax=Frigoribacterium faeni TaxID=145483 RepID=UPI00141BDC59|nr:hypothetical protein [Frigoribacterium faeni]NIJ05030.1 hypothetical protein [Frigoribacterium faeni]